MVSTEVQRIQRHLMSLGACCRLHMAIRELQGGLLQSCESISSFLHRTPPELADRQAAGKLARLEVLVLQIS